MQIQFQVEQFQQNFDDSTSFIPAKMGHFNEQRVCKN